MVSLPPTQLATQTLVQHFIAKIDYMNIQAYLQDDSTNFQWGLHSFAEAFQHFSIRPKIDTLCAYLRKLDLPDGPVHNSSRLHTGGPGLNEF